MSRRESAKLWGAFAATEEVKRVFCPRCGCEYRDGFTECADCHVPLAAEPPPPPPEPEYIAYEPMLSTHNGVDIDIINAVLESEGITYFFEGDIFNLVRPLVQPARLMVRKDQVQQAKEVLEELKLAYFAFPHMKDEQEEQEET